MPDSPPSLGQSTPLVPPLYQSSVYTLPDLDALDRILNAEAPGYIYARDGHPNASSQPWKAPSGESCAAPGWPRLRPGYLPSSNRATGSSPAIGSTAGPPNC